MRHKVLVSFAVSTYLRAIDLRWLWRFPPALLLAVAAGGKLRATGWGHPSGEFPSWLIGLSIGELVLAWWLLSGARPRWEVAAGLITFVAFTIISLTKGLLGKGNCGCLGVVEVSPWTMVFLDGAMGFCLIMSCRGRRKDEFQATAPNEGVRRIRKQIGAIWGALLLVLAVTVSAVVWSDRWLVGTASNDFILVQPSLWVGKSVDQIHDIPQLARLAEGNWYVLFYRDGCEECRQAKSEFVQKLAEYQQKGYQCAWVRIPDSKAPNGDATPISVPSDIWLISLPGSRTWVFQAPMYMTVRQGTVCRVEWNGADFRHEDR